ncbi:hypothetical protein [Capnocytophaga leadbetteri]|uniref:hypothetical protein n=1 Tax=Capnocytophaga leadbetteri TaxID=327575 RepID=UPI0028EEBD47|nr:hypothetical protein [Capnocytophaga leadbetteri]
MTAITTLYKWFSDLMKPTGAQFKALIDSFWHKSEKIPMDNIDGLNKLIEGTASAKQLQNHINDTHAHKEVLDKKVDKVPGKILSTEDFTTELRQKLEGLQQVDTSGLLPKGGYTGTAQDLKNLIDAINRILQSDDTDLDQLQEIVTYIKQNKHILSTLGISNIAGLVEALAAKAEKDHHHDERYAPITHHHNEYALRTHRHNWDDFDGKPNNLATTESVKTAVEGIQIGGRNYVLNSKPKLTSVGYMGQYWNLSEPVVIGEQYTFSCYATIEKERILRVYFIDVSGQPRQYIIDKLVNGYNKFTVIPNYSWSGLCVFYEVLGISPTPTATIEKLKFEKGNKPTDWSPAPEDFDFFKGGIQLSDLNTFKNRETGGFSVNTGGGWGAYLNFKLDGSTSSLEFFKPNWYPYSRMGIRNSVDNSRFNDDNGGFRDLAWYDDILRAGVECTQNSKLQREHQNQTIFVTVSCSIELNTIDDLSSVSFRKVFDNGIVSFSCFGKNIIYTSDNQFDGKKGSTAVVSRYGNDCYIDIRNV